MIQTIGLIIAVYALARMVQVPVEMTGAKETFLAMPLWSRVAFVAGVSAVALVVLLILTLMLLFSGAELARGSKY